LAWTLGGVGLAAASGAQPQTLGPVAAGFLLAAWGSWPRSPRLAALRGAALFAAAVWGLTRLQRALPLATGRQELGPDLQWSALAVALAFLGGWLSAPQGERPGPADRWLAAAAAALLVASAAHDSLPLAAASGAVGCALAALWWTSLAGRRLRAGRLVGLVILASVAAGLAWQVAHRSVVRDRLETQVLPILAPPSGDELNDLLIELHGFFDGFEVDRITPPPAGEATDPSDLPYALWRASPLPQRDGLSAVVVESAGGQREFFSFGLAFTAAGEPLPSPARWPMPPWRDGMIQGQGLLLSGGQLWGQVSFWFMPRPGFRRSVDERRELERNLVRGKPRSETADGLPAETRYALYDLGGRSRLSPWDEAPSLAAAVVEGERCGRRETPDGDSWCWTQRGSEGIDALFLPALSPRVALERVGLIAMNLVPILLLVGAAALAGAAPRDLGGLVRDGLRSYSRRLVLVFTLLLLLPMIALNLFLLQSAEQRLRDNQLADARNAMVSARTLLIDYLRGLEPGFLIGTQVHRELLEWIGGLVGHQVNLYWGSRLYASSQQEMFTAGLLPSRIPGEVYTGLSLLGSDLRFRRQQTGDLTYLEVYTPIDVPGIVSSQQNLFLSVPLVEQDEDAARELGLMRRRALLVTSSLFLLTLAVAGRLSRRFTEPIVQLIEGTRRIARDETYEPVEPRETELQSLAAAIGEMAERVTASRRGLEREKNFVERVLDNITSAVVSVDAENRVALQNRVARDLLGTAAGDALGEALGRSELLAPVRAFVLEAAGSREPKSEEVKLRPSDERVDVFEWTLAWVPIPGGENPAALLVIEDSTEQLRGQRLEAWAEMARIIAHEIKNPLTPIRLSTEHLQQVYRASPERLDEVLERCCDNILRNVDELREIASEFSIYSRIPSADLKTGDLVEAMAELAAFYRDAPRSGVQVEFRRGGEGGDGAAALERLDARFDKKLLGRAVRNLMENALRATAHEGGTVVLEVARVPSPEGARAELRVTDSGPGVDPQKLERIFEPYFSTYESGTGLGLAITRRIVQEHGGEIEARNRPRGGLRVIVRLPLERPETAGLLTSDP
ncbi:MAG: ATP-binding protein, partial [Acidobacteriota bacterium]